MPRHPGALRRRPNSSSSSAYYSAAYNMRRTYVRKARFISQSALYCLNYSRDLQ